MRCFSDKKRPNRYFWLRYLIVILCLVLYVSTGYSVKKNTNKSASKTTATKKTPNNDTLFPETKEAKRIEKFKKVDGIKISTFLGNETRTYYGYGPVPEKLELIWKTSLGSGQTSGKGGAVTWSGSGWTGQPTLVNDGGKLYIIIGGFDYNLRKIDAVSGETVWKYKMDDVIKSTNTVFENPNPTSEEDKIIVMIGSRRGFGKSFADPSIASYRAVSFSSGKELWRLPIPITRSYSRDVDGSGLFKDGLVYLGIESGLFYILDPFKTSDWNGYQKPNILHEQVLYTENDISRHGGNLVTEASSALFDNTFFISSGSGHVYGLDKDSAKIVWDFYIGSDLDGTTVITKDGFLLTPVEKEYIAGKGGVFKLNPKMNSSEAVVWYFPTENKSFFGWLGGVIGSVAVNDETNKFDKKPALAAFNAIDGNVYVVSQDNLTEGTVPDHENQKKYPRPITVFKKNIGGGISTPLLVDDYLITAGYNSNLYIFKINYFSVDDTEHEGVVLSRKDGSKVKVNIVEVSAYPLGGSVESTPIVWDGRIYIGSRNGNFYCLGEKK